MTVLPAVLAAAMTAVVVLSGVRLLAAGRGPAVRHPRDAELWHAVMAAAMAAMLLVSFTAGVSRGVLALSAVGVVWCLGQLALRRRPGVYLPLGVCCAAMAAMVVPVALASTAAAEPGAAMAGHSMAGHSMAGHSMGGSSTAGSVVQQGVPAALVVVLIAAMAAVVLVTSLRLVRRRSGPDGSSLTGLDGVREIVMAGAMGYMLVGLV